MPTTPNNTPTFHALVIKLTAQESGSLAAGVGEMAHAAFYAAIQAVDPDLSAHMHDAQQRKAFSLSPLYGYRQQHGRLRVRAGDQGWLRLGLLDDQLFGVFMQHLLDSRQPVIRLGPVHFAITEVLGSPGGHPWVGYTTLEQLRALDETPQRWRLEFASPTAIRWGEADSGTRRVEVFPQPRMTIAGLRKRWDRWTGETWGRDFEEWVERNVVVSRVWRWETKPVIYRKQTYVGGQGQLEYRLLDGRERAKAIHLNRLLQLAFFTGVGYKTTHGLGQMRVMEPSTINRERKGPNG